MCICLSSVAGWWKSIAGTFRTKYKLLLDNGNRGNTIRTNTDKNNEDNRFLLSKLLTLEL